VAADRLHLRVNQSRMDRTMFTLGVSDYIMIAHHIADPAFGRAQSLHGATYSVEAQLRVKELNAHSVVMDISVFRSMLRAILDELDYTNLDEHPAFAGSVSTTERVAEFIAHRFAQQISQLDADQRPHTDGSIRISVRESPVAYAGFERPL
jgi:6-pyruvoyltetrahydropterin/6-carboxytetrahydropterin synthase